MFMPPAQTFLLGSLTFLLLLLLALEILRLIVFAVLKITKKKLPAWAAKLNRRLLPFLVVLAAGEAAVGMHNAGLDPEVTRAEIEVPERIKNFRGLKAVILTDLHVYEGTDENFCERLKDKVNAEKPDVVFVLGDMADGFVEDMGDKLLPLAKLESRYGTYVVPGNHEYYWNYGKWMRFYEEKLGMKALVNAHAVLPETNCVVAGIPDKAAAKSSCPLPDPAKALSGTERDALKIVLSHRPTECGKIAEAGGDVQFSGHTHGGMVTGFDLIVKAFNEGLTEGEYERNGIRIFVSSGAGLWHGFPFRIFHPAEVNVVTFQASRDVR